MSRDQLGGPSRRPALTLRVTMSSPLGAENPIYRGHHPTQDPTQVFGAYPGKTDQPRRKVSAWALVMPQLSHQDCPLPPGHLLEGLKGQVVLGPPLSTLCLLNRAPGPEPSPRSQVSSGHTVQAMGHLGSTQGQTQ